MKGDALALPYDDASFDVVVAAEILEHIVEDSLAMAEIARVVRPGGRVAVTVPRWLPERICWALSADYHNVEGGHVRIYTRADLVSKLRSAGLQSYDGHYAHGLHSPYWWLKCLVGVQDERHVLPRLYHRLLVWDIMRRPLVTRAAEAVLNPVLGKSLVVYLRKAGGAGAAG
jgi:SAM-dependent methyltransferase